MSPLQQKPILHGRDHCPGGADPIPGLAEEPRTRSRTRAHRSPTGPRSTTRAVEFNATDGTGTDATIVTIPGQTFLSPQPGHRIGTTEDRWYSAGVVSAGTIRPTPRLPTGSWLSPSFPPAT